MVVPRHDEPAGVVHVARRGAEFFVASRVHGKHGEDSLPGVGDDVIGVGARVPQPQRVEAKRGAVAERHVHERVHGLGVEDRERGGGGGVVVQRRGRAVGGGVEHRAGDDEETTRGGASRSDGGGSESHVAATLPFRRGGDSSGATPPGARAGGGDGGEGRHVGRGEGEEGLTRGGARRGGDRAAGSRTEDDATFRSREKPRNVSDTPQQSVSAVGFAHQNVRFTNPGCRSNKKCHVKIKSLIIVTPVVSPPHLNPLGAWSDFGSRHS